MDQLSFIPLDILSSHRQIKLCYEFVKSSDFYHQEISVFNPYPSQFDPQYIFPLDMFLLTFHKDYDQTPPSLDDLTKMVEINHAPIQCIGSHRSDVDRSIQLLWMPAEGGRDPQLILQFISDVTAMEKQRIVDDLLQMCSETNTDSVNG